MKRLIEEELEELLTAADRKVPIGSTIKHRKSGDLYHVMNIALREHDLVPLIIYRREDTFVRFARSIHEILERFTLVSAPGGEVEAWF